MKISDIKHTSLESLSSYIITLIRFSICTGFGILANIYYSGLSFSSLMYEKKGIMDANPVAYVVFILNFSVPKCFSLKSRLTSLTSSEAIIRFINVTIC